MAEVVCTAESYNQVVGDMIEQHYVMVQRLMKKGVPLVNGPLDMEISGVMLTADGFAKYQLNTDQSRTAPEVQTSEVPEVTTTTTGNHLNKASTKGQNVETAKDSATNQSQENGKETLNDKTQRDSTTTDTNDSNTHQSHGTRDDVTLSVYS